MDVFNKTIKKLSEEEYNQLLKEVSDRRESKPYQVLEAARFHNYDDAKMMELLNVNSAAYYTLKSRLKSKLAGILSKKVENPIKILLDEVSLVPANLFTNNREVSIRALKELEKQLLEYDLNNELIIIYKTLARLHYHNYDFEYYTKLYNRYTAYSLAVAKAENLYFDFFRKLQTFLLTRNDTDYEAIFTIKRELLNIKELYDSHRLSVLNSFVNTYSICFLTNDINELKMKEIEVDNELKEIQETINKYNLDTFYQNNKVQIDFLYFEFYSRTQNIVRADHYHKKIIEIVNDVAEKYIFHFQVSCFMQSSFQLYNITKNLAYLDFINSDFDQAFDADKEEIYVYIKKKMGFALHKYAHKEYGKSAKLINDIRMDVTLRNYLFTDVELKLFQCLQYCFLGDEELAMQILNSVKRQIPDEKDELLSLKHFLKIVSVCIKPSEFKKKVTKITQLYRQFLDENQGEKKLLDFIVLDDKQIKELADPYKK